jgi:hypothetical protein
VIVDQHEIGREGDGIGAPIIGRKVADVDGIIGREPMDAVVRITE